MVAKTPPRPGRRTGPKNVDVRARIDENTKETVNHVLEGMGLTTSEAIRMFLTRVAAEEKLPFTPEVPNPETRAAMAEVEAGEGKSFSSAEELFADMREDADADSSGDDTV